MANQELEARFLPLLKRRHADDCAPAGDDRYRQASVDGLTRLSTVLSGGEDRPSKGSNGSPCPPITRRKPPKAMHWWVIILLVPGTIIPMATWWCSRADDPTAMSRLQ